MPPDKIKSARKSLFKNQQEAAAWAMVTQSAWSKWERGHREMPRFIAAALSQKLKSSKNILK
jgi:DNA-binding transcriptional regulator YiaG